MAVSGGLRAQSRLPARIGYLVIGDRASNVQWLTEFEESLAKLGWTVGRDLLLEYRYGEGEPTRLATAVRELLAMKLDVIVTGGISGASVLAALTTTIPIVGNNLADPVGAGLVRSLARPGGNLTGVTASIGPGILAKRLQMLRAFVPRARRVAILRAQGEFTSPLWHELADAASTLDIALLPVDTTNEGFPAAFASIAAQRVDAMCLVGQGTLLKRMFEICDFTLRERLPATYALKPYARAGLLFTYGIDAAEGYRRSAGYVDRILRGAQPGDLPIERLNRYELAINRRTAGLLGVRVPPDLLLQADEVIG